MFLRERLTAGRANVTYFQDVIVATPGRRNMVVMVINSTTHNAVDVSALIKFVVIVSHYFHTTNTVHKH